MGLSPVGYRDCVTLRTPRRVITPCTRWGYQHNSSHRADLRTLLSQTLENLASVDGDNRIVFCTLERPPSKIATLSPVRFPLDGPAIPAAA